MRPLKERRNGRGIRRGCTPRKWHRAQRFKTKEAERSRVIVRPKALELLQFVVSTTKPVFLAKAL